MAKQERADKVVAWAREHINANAQIVGTGGGCSALEIPIEGGAFWWISDDAEAPTALTCKDGFSVGIYGPTDERRWVLFQAPTLRAAATLIAAYVANEL